jgi:hypothetical protein
MKENHDRFRALVPEKSLLRSTDATTSLAISKSVHGFLLPRTAGQKMIGNAGQKLVIKKNADQDPAVRSVIRDQIVRNAPQDLAKQFVRIAQIEKFALSELASECVAQSLEGEIAKPFQVSVNAELSLVGKSAEPSKEILSVIRSLTKKISATMSLVSDVKLYPVETTVGTFLTLSKNVAMRLNTVLNPTLV